MLTVDWTVCWLLAQLDIVLLKYPGTGPASGLTLAQTEGHH